MLVIRQESVNDYEQVYNVIKTAFEKAEYRDGKEQDLVVSLRKSNSFIPELSLVAEDKNKIIGYILFTKVKIGDNTELALAPLAVLPEYQRKGIGKKLIKEGHKIAKQLNYDYSIVLGSNQYYPRLGYIPASKYNIKAPFEVEDDCFMAIQLSENAKTIKGIVEYDEAFGIEEKITIQGD